MLDFTDFHNDSESEFILYGKLHQTIPTKGAVSSVGRASRLHRGGRQFEPVTAH